MRIQTYDQTWRAPSPAEEQYLTRSGKMFISLYSSSCLCKTSSCCC